MLVQIAREVRLASARLPFEQHERVHDARVSFNLPECLEKDAARTDELR